MRKVLVDIDGTLLDTVGSFCDWVNEYSAEGLRITPEMLTKYDAIDELWYPGAMEHYMEFIDNFHDQIRVYPGAMEALAYMSEWFDVEIVSSRPELQRKLFEDRFGWHVTSKDEVTDGDILIDDYPKWNYPETISVVFYVKRPWTFDLVPNVLRDTPIVTVTVDQFAEAVNMLMEDFPED